MSGRPNNAAVVDACTRRLNALKSYVDGKVQIAINGRKLTLPEVVAIYQSSLDSRAAIATKHAEMKAALGVRAGIEETRLEADRALKAWVVNEFGVESTEAIDFGFPPPRVGKRTVEEKATAVALAAATRKARHTMGKKQKSLIKGTVVVPAAPEEPANHAPAGASTAGQQQQTQMQMFDGAQAPAGAAGAGANGATSR